MDMEYYVDANTNLIKSGGIHTFLTAKKIISNGGSSRILNKHSYCLSAINDEDIQIEVQFEQYYNLDVIISVGHCAKSKQETQFCDILYNHIITAARYITMAAAYITSMISYHTRMMGIMLTY